MLFVRGLFNAEALKGNIRSSQTGNLPRLHWLLAAKSFRHQHRSTARPALRIIRPRISLVLGCKNRTWFGA
jgi:hypothetical protein